MNYAEISKETISYLYKSHASLKNSPLDPAIRVLVELRTSQINGCAYCCGLHTNEARSLHVSQEKLDKLPAWHTATLFTEKEIIALQLCEELTYMSDDHIDIKEILAEHFSEREIVDLVACISLMNALNRIAISLRD